MVRSAWPGPTRTRLSAADALADSLPRTTLVVGKGGVGKTTCAAALALRCAARERTLVLSTDPARALPTVLGQQLAAQPGPVTGVDNLDARLLDAAALRRDFLARWGPAITSIIDRGTYLDTSEIAPLVDTALPGSDEIFAALALAALLEDNATYRRIIVDTAPTGHTLRLLQLPTAFRALVRLLDTMQAKHRFMVRTLAGRYRADDADAFLAQMGRLADTLDATFRDRARCAAVMVTNADPVVLDETRRYLDALARERVHVAAVVWNRAERAAAALPSTAPAYVVRRLEEWPIGIDGLSRWADAMRPAAGRRAQPSRARRARQSPSPSRGRAAILEQTARLLRPLTIVAGKGGVGKTTVACALALRAASRHRTLLVSTDPAPSLADVLAQAIPDADTAVRRVPRLFARQMDATAAFERMRAEYQERVDALFAGVLGGGMDLTHDRAIARDLLALAPPGIDEVYALSLIADALFQDRFGRVVVDPAPTGHLLRLLEMPALALAWTHQLMRLMLKYKDITGLGDAARDLLVFSRSLRALAEVLHDPQRCAVVLVAMPEPVVEDETRRLASAIAGMGVHVSGVIWNQAAISRHPLPAIGAAVHFQAPPMHPPPMGASALRHWNGSWTLA